MILNYPILSTCIIFLFFSFHFMCICACVCVSLCELKHDVKGSHEEVQNRSYRLERSQVWLEKSCFIIPFTFAWRSVGALVSSPSHDPVVSESGVCVRACSHILLGPQRRPRHYFSFPLQARQARVPRGAGRGAGRPPPARPPDRPRRPARRRPLKPR